VVAAGAYVHRCTEPGGDDWVAGRRAGLRPAVRAARPATSAPVPARRGAPLLSACMIVKDEEDDLGGCLAALRGLVDEVVVYDTGSTDGTVALARAAGATVVEGYWDDDFGRARNAALAACSGTWVLHVDADERLTGDAEALRRLLAGSDADGLALEIANQDGAGRVVSRHRAVRLFRRARGWWTGRLHEQVTHRPGQAPLVVGPTAVMGIDHHGYAAEALESRDKRNRNVRLAEAALGDDHGVDRPRRLLDLGRALTAAHRYDEAQVRFEEARATATSPIVRRTVLWQGAELLLVVGRPGEALRWVEELRAISDRDDVASFLEAVARLMLGDAGGSLSALDGVQDLWAEDGNFALSADLVAHQRAAALLAAERWEEAADALDSLLAERPHLPLWGSWARATWRAGRPVGDVADAVPDAELRGALTQVLLVEDEVADAVGEHLWGRRAGDARLVAFAAHLGARLPAVRALEWSSRVRAAGLAERCPLIARAGRSGLAPTERVRSAALAAGAFGDPRAALAVAQAAPLVADADLVAVLLELGELAPALLPGFIASAATVPARLGALADALDQLGASEQAEVLRGSAPEA
jgi:tetratricopeptide (TPR) repeat protein